MRKCTCFNEFSVCVYVKHSITFACFTTSFLYGTFKIIARVKRCFCHNKLQQNRFFSVSALI